MPKLRGDWYAHGAGGGHGMLRVWSAVAVLGCSAAMVLAQGAGQAGRSGAGENARTAASALPVIQGEIDGKATDPVVERVLGSWPEGRIDTVKNPGEWSYEEGVLLDGMTAEWRATGDGRLFQYVHAAVDRSVDEKGAIQMSGGRPFPVDAHSLDNIEMGRSVLTLYRVLRKPRYYTTAKFLHDQVEAQPRNASGGYWHKEIYPNQMWLDGAYMAEPFMANYARTFDHPEEMDGAARQLLLMAAKMSDRQTGLLHHGWDDSGESGKMNWANPKTGLSPEVWARAMGWYVMALFDVLERMPASDPQRAALEDVAQRTMAAVVHYQDPESGLWWQVMDKGGQKGNYLEASASCMFVYALAKGVRLGVLPLSSDHAAVRGWAAIQSRFVKPDGTLSGTVKVAGLGGTPYRSGTYDYYVGEAVGDNDAKGVGSYLLALSEMTQRRRAGAQLARARGKTVLFDAWFNSQTRKSADGHEELFHYKPNDDADSGYSFWARMFGQYGMRVESLPEAPRTSDLKGASIYVMPSPDNLKLNPNAHFMDRESAEAVVAWVKAGGVLVFMENDVDHADQTHFDLLSDQFGIHFNPVLRNAELNGSYDNTVVPIPAGLGGIFRHAHKAVMKETCTIAVSSPAKPVLVDRGDTMMAVAHLGRGLVYANVDPWVYNEYTNGLKTPLDNDNFAGGQELTRWLVGEAVAR